MARTRTRQPFARRPSPSLIAAPPAIEADFSRGMVRDMPRVAIPQGAVYDSLDFMLDKPGIAYKRGGTTYATTALGSSTAVPVVMWADFTGGNELVSVANDRHVYAGAAGTTDKGSIGADAGYIPIDIPKLFVNRVILPAAAGNHPPAKYDGTLGTWGGSPPNGRYVAVYKSRVVLGSSVANENRVWFSPVPDPEGTWDTTNSWIDCDNKITGFAALQNALLVFSEGWTERIIGATPPPASDMDRSPIGPIGCTDPRSIVIMQDNAIFANPDGVFMSNGLGFTNLTAEGLISTYWQSLFTGYKGVRTADPWTLSAGRFRDFYIINVSDSHTAGPTFICYVPRRAWWRVSNIFATMFATAVGDKHELYYGEQALGRVTKVGSMFTSGGAATDANDTAVTPLLETRMVGQGTGIKQFGLGWVDYDMRVGGTPTLAVSVAPGLEATTYAAVTESPLPATADMTRKRFTVAKRGQGVNIKLQQSGQSSKTEIYAIELEQTPFSLVEGGIS